MITEELAILWVVLAGGWSWATWAPRVVSQARVGVVVEVSAPSPEGCLQESRPLRIEEAGSTLVSASLKGPAFRPPDLFTGFDEFHNPRMKRLRDEYRLDEVIQGEDREFQRLMKLRHWVHTRWPVDNDQKFSGDAFAILEKAKSGAGLHCSHSMAVQHAVMASMGYVVRDLGVDADHEKTGRSRHHGVNEVWSNEYAKWVLLDAKYDIHFEREGLPLSALEVHDAVRAGKSQTIVMVKGAERRPTEMCGPGAVEGSSVDNYWWVSYGVRQNKFTQPRWDGASRLLIPDDDGFRKTLWYRTAREGVNEKHWAYAANAFIPIRDPREIEWTPGVPGLRVRQESSGDLEVRMQSATPNLKEYRVRTNGGPWRTCEDDRIRCPLTDGESTLDVRTRNLFGVDGPVVTLVIRKVSEGNK